MEKTHLAASVRYLQNAISTAREYLQREASDHAPEVFQIYVNFLVNKISGVEKTASSISRRLKEEVLLPEDVEEAAVLVRDLQIRQAELMHERKNEEKLELELAAANAAASAAAAAAKAAESTPVQVVIKKPPLPPLPIPRFSGDPMEYSNFISIFNETVHKNDTLAPSQKLVYLQSYVDGAAKSLIGRILITDANYESAREILKANFGHSSQTISFLYDKLHSVQRARNDPFSIRDTFNEVESILQMLENAGVEVNADQYLRYEVLRKWSFALAKQLVRTTDMTLQNFRKELKSEVELQIQLTQATGYVQPTPASQKKPYDNRPTR